MSTDRQSERHGHDGFAEFTEELRLLAEVLLAKVEPVLRRTAADGQADLGGCAWCPVCAAAALVRGDHHDVVAALADHGTSMVTVLREALAGIPVEPVLPPEWSEHGAGHQHSSHGATNGGEATGHDQTPGAGTTPPSQHPGESASGAPGRPRYTAAEHADVASGGASRGAPRRTEPTARPRRVDEYAAPRPPRTPQAPHIAPESGEAASASDAGAFATAPPKGERRRPAPEDRSTTARAPRSQYVDIPVTIRG
ncbi:hypothetical protein ACFWUP_18520 [Nocardia sp. NPDC058658]|uniref:hypothetical protein n=1 Tax=Nocardia sp. NPDC058658 TaxID=3346580 RepID=UPI0036656975